MQENCQYTQLSVDGKWISLARLWLNNNCPCSREKMFTELGLLMPGTIRSSNHLLSSASAVRSAHKRIYGSSEIPERIEKPPATSPNGTGATDRIRAVLSERSEVSLSDLRHVKNASKLVLELAARGECVRVRRGVYSRTGKLKATCGAASAQTTRNRRNE